MLRVREVLRCRESSSGGSGSANGGTRSPHKHEGKFIVRTFGTPSRGYLQTEDISSISKTC